MITTEHLSLTIVAGNYQVPTENVVLQECSIISSVRQNVPVARLVFADSVGFFHNVVSLSDGLPIEISIGNTQATAVTYKFRLFMPRNNVGSTGNSVVLIMYYDAPVYFGGTTSTSFQKSSADAISEIAANNGFMADVDESHDLMTWVPGNVRWCQFASAIASAGWASQTSAFMLGLTETGVLRYKDVGSYTFDPTLPTFRLGALTSDGTYIPVASWSQVVVSGFHNMRGAYHGAQQNQSYTSVNGVVETTTSVKKIKGNQFLYINSDVKASLVNAKLFSWSTVDCGNTHANYQTAIYQNKRLLKTLSSRLSALTMMQTGLTILDKVQVQAFLPSTGGETPQVEVGASGYYFIVGKTIYAGMDGIYCEKFELARDGTNQDLQQDMQ